MDLKQDRVKKIKIKKSKPATFTNRLSRSVKYRYVSDRWLRNISIISVLLIFIFLILFVFWYFPMPEAEHKEDKTIKVMPAEK